MPAHKIGAIGRSSPNGKEVKMFFPSQASMVECLITNEEGVIVIVPLDELLNQYADEINDNTKAAASLSEIVRDGGVGASSIPSDTPPENPTDGQYWNKPSGSSSGDPEDENASANGYIPFRYNAKTGEWEPDTKGMLVRYVFLDLDGEERLDEVIAALRTNQMAIQDKLTAGELKGKDGITYEWLLGASAPAAALGKVGDMYINTTSFDVHKKTAETTWALQGNIKGATGPTGAQGTLHFMVTTTITAAPTGSRVNDLVVNGGADSLTIGGRTLAIGDCAPITTLSPLALGAVTGNLRGATGPVGPASLGSMGMTELDDIAICCGNFSNAAAGWCSYTFPREFDGVPAVTIQPVSTEGFVLLNNVTPQGFQYQVRTPMANSTTTTAAVELSYIAVYDGGIDN